MRGRREWARTRQGGRDCRCQSTTGACCVSPGLCDASARERPEPSVDRRPVASPCGARSASRARLSLSARIPHHARIALEPPSRRLGELGFAMSHYSHYVGTRYPMLSTSHRQSLLTRTPWTPIRSRIATLAIHLSSYRATRWSSAIPGCCPGAPSNFFAGCELAAPRATVLADQHPGCPRLPIGAQSVTRRYV